jgi:hypothetical protein
MTLREGGTQQLESSVGANISRVQVITQGVGDWMRARAQATDPCGSICNRH